MNKNDVFGGFGLIGFAGAYALAAGNLSLFSSFGIGPGLFPIALAGILALLGLSIVVRGFFSGVADDGELREKLPLRGLVMIAAGPLVFGVLVGPLGVVPALLAAIFLSALANVTTTIRAAFISAVLLTAFCVALFRWGLDLPLQLFGPWLQLGI